MKNYTELCPSCGNVITSYLKSVKLCVSCNLVLKTHDNGDITINDDGTCFFDGIIKPVGKYVLLTFKEKPL